MKAVLSNFQLFEPSLSPNYIKIYSKGQRIFSSVINKCMTKNTCEYFDTDMAASLLGVSVSTMKRWCKSVGGPVFYKFGRSIKYTTADLREWAKSNQHRVNRSLGFYP